MSLGAANVAAGAIGGSYRSHERNPRRLRGQRRQNVANAAVVDGFGADLSFAARTQGQDDRVDALQRAVKGIGSSDVARFQRAR